MRIGIDLDNTIICYDRIFHTVAVERDQIPRTFANEKQAIRDYIRKLPDGEVAWTALQAEIYGPRLSEAEVFPGVHETLRNWRANGHELFIVSHKTRYAAADRAQACDLRVAALAWLSENALAGPPDAPVSLANIHFASERAAKCRIISDLCCDLFVDDLTEVFLEADFPAHVRGVLFQADLVPGLPANLVLARNWQEVAGAVAG